MAREPILKIDGKALPSVVSVKYEVYNGRNDDGRPTKQQSCQGITVKRIADKSTTIAGWAKDTTKSKRKKGSIEFKDLNNEKLKTLEWEEGYIQEYSMYYDHTQDDVVEEFVIMPKKLGYGGKKIDLKWKKK